MKDRLLAAKNKTLIYLPFIFLAAAVITNYFHMLLEWFLISTGLLLLFSVLINKGDKPQDQTPASKGPNMDTILNGITDPAFVYDQNFKIVMFNRSAEKLFNLSQSDAIGHVLDPKDAQDVRWQRLVQVVFPSLAPDIIPRSREGEFPQIVDVIFSSPEAEWRTTTSTISSQEFNGFLKVVQDRTKEAVMMKEKTEFITVASHQLRTPVTSIIWSLESLKNSTNLQGEEKNLAQASYESAKRLGSMVEDLLSISRIEEGKLGYNFQVADIVSFMTNLLSAALPQARRLGIKIFFDKPDNLPPVYIDQEKLGMAVSNLLDNAIRYNTKDGEVAVRIKQETNRPFLEISIRDTGIGIPEEDAKNLFQKFFRASNAIKFETEGSGLGLYIAKSILQAHGGTIRAESEVNKGTVFTLEIPTDHSLIPPREVPMR